MSKRKVKPIYKRTCAGFELIRGKRKVVKRFAWGRIERGVEPPVSRDYHTRDVCMMLEVGDSVVTGDFAAAEAMKTMMRRVYGLQALRSKREGSMWRIWRLV